MLLLREQDGRTALMYAASNENIEAVKALLAAGAATDLQNKVCLCLPPLPPPGFLPPSSPPSLSSLPSFVSLPLPESILPKMPKCVWEGKERGRKQGWEGGRKTEGQGGREREGGMDGGREGDR